MNPCLFINSMIKLAFITYDEAEMLQQFSDKKKILGKEKKESDFRTKELVKDFHEQLKKKELKPVSNDNKIVSNNITGKKKLNYGNEFQQE